MKILISGGGIAGLCHAYWLHAFGFKPTVIEKWPSLRNHGYMMDYFGSGHDVGTAMGINKDLKKADHNFREIIFTDKKGKRRRGGRCHEDEEPSK